MYYPDTQQNIQNGRSGGYTDVTGKTYQEQQRIDYEVNIGRREANR